MNDQQYSQAQKRIVELSKQAPDVSWEELHELGDLQEACQQYQDALDQDAAVEYDTMVRFEECFLASMER